MFPLYLKCTLKVNPYYKHTNQNTTTIRSHFDHLFHDAPYINTDLCEHTTKGLLLRVMNSKNDRKVTIYFYKACIGLMKHMYMHGDSLDILSALIKILPLVNKMEILVTEWVSHKFQISS